MEENYKTTLSTSRIIVTVLIPIFIIVIAFRAVNVSSFITISVIMIFLALSSLLVGRTSKSSEKVTKTTPLRIMGFIVVSALVTGIVWFLIAAYIGIKEHGLN